MSDPHRSRLCNAQMCQLTALTSDHGLDALSPRPPRLKCQPSGSRATQMHNIRACLVGCPALVWRVEAALLDTSHPDLLRPKFRPADYATPVVFTRPQPTRGRIGQAESYPSPNSGSAASGQNTTTAGGRSSVHARQPTGPKSLVRPHSAHASTRSPSSGSGTVRTLPGDGAAA